MGRNRQSAKRAGAKFTREIADYLAEHVDDRIEPRVLGGNKDRGDIGGLRHYKNRIVVECKNYSKDVGLHLSEWADEAETERGNDDALAGIVAHKRHGKGDPADQWITMTVRDFVAFLTLERPA